MSDAPAPKPVTPLTWPESFPATVRTTFQPEVDVQLDVAEYTDLSRQGLLVPGHDGLTK